MKWRLGVPRAGRLTVSVAVGVTIVLVLGLAAVGAGLIGGGSVLFSAGQRCSGDGTGGSARPAGAAVQPTASAAGRATIPADYLHFYRHAGQTYGVPWPVLAGIGEVVVPSDPAKKMRSPGSSCPGAILGPHTHCSSEVRGMFTPESR